MGALDEEDLYDDEMAQLLALPTPDLSGFDDDAAEEERQSVLDLPVKPPLQPQASRPLVTYPQGTPVAQPGFDWRRAIVAAGKGDVRQYDANKLRREQAPLLEEERRRTRARLDPLSPESKQAQDEYASVIQAFSQVPGAEGIKGFLDAESNRLGRLSAADIDKAIPRLERLAGVQLRGANIQGLKDRSDKTLIAKREALLQRAKQFAEAQGLQWANLDERKQARFYLQARHEAERDEDAAKEFGKDVAPLETELKTLESVRAGMGDMKTGWLPEKWNKVRQAIGLGDERWDTQEGALASVRNHLRHDLFGGALTPQEAAQYDKELPGLNVPRATFDAKLAQVMQKIRLKIDEFKKKNPRGAAVSEGITTQADQQKPPHGKRAYSAKTGKYYVWDGSKYVEE